MKVTVCFGNTKVIVPCGSGDLTIRELQERACQRYRKILGKDSDYEVSIIQLESGIDGGIFDSDDLVSDVVDNREKLIAIFEENGDQNESSIQQSASCHQNGEMEQRHFSFEKKGSMPADHRKYNSLEIDVGTETLKSNTRVMVRKNDQASLNSSSQKSDLTQDDCLNGSSIYDPRSDSSIAVSSTPVKAPIERRLNSKEQDYFRRGAAARQSKGDGLSEIMDEIPRDDYSLMYDYVASRIRADSTNKFSAYDSRFSNLPWFYQESQEVSFINDRNVEALKVGSFIDQQSGKFAGLLVQSIAQSSPIARESVLVDGDVIVGINEQVLMDFAFEDAEAMLLESLTHSHVQFRILPVEDRQRHMYDSSSHSNSSSSKLKTFDVDPAIAYSLSSRINSSSSSASTQPKHGENPRVYFVVTVQNSHSSNNKPILNQLTADTVGRYTKKIGNRITVQLKKDVQGLGFTLTSRDTSIGGPNPIYIKQILPGGAAVRNGRLQSGDRLLDIDGDSVLGKSQVEVVSMLRAVPIGSKVNITISRQSENLPRKLQLFQRIDIATDSVRQMIEKYEAAGRQLFMIFVDLEKRDLTECLENLADASVDDAGHDEADKEFFVFEIPLNDTGSAGLGIGLKGKYCTKTGKNSGVYVKNVICGGAASQDGRLLPNDQLIEVNGHSLRGLSNEEAIHVLKKSMSTEANVRGYIEMVIARRRKYLDRSTSQISSEASSDLCDLTFDQIYPEPDASLNLSSSERRRHAPKRSWSFAGNSLSARCKRLPLQTTSRVTHVTTSKSSLRGVPAPHVFRDSRKQIEAPTRPVDLALSPRTNSQSTDRSKTNSQGNPDVIICDEKDLEWPNDEPFSRESTIRQSISEKRRNATARPPLSVYASPKIEKRGFKVDKASKQGEKNANKKVVEMNGKLLSPLRQSQTVPNLGIQVNNNNNSTYFWRVPEPRKLKKSASTDSLAGEIKVTGSNLAGNPTKQINESNVGPSLGIAKSSSLESLQTAMRSVKHTDEPSLPNPRPFTKVIRGRVLNESFRAALDQTSDPSQELSTLETHRHNDVKEIGFQPNGDSTKTYKKKTKLFGFLKSSKPKKTDENTKGTSIISESELYRREIEARKQKDNQKNRGDIEQLEAYREKLTQSRTADKSKPRHRDQDRVPNPLQSRNENFHSKSKSSNVSRDVAQPPPLPSSEHHTKQNVDSSSSLLRNRDIKQFGETPSYYSSLPRQTRRESGEIPPSTIVKVTNSGRSSLHKKENLDFYNRYKPSSVKKATKPSVQSLLENADDTSLSSPEKANSVSPKVTDSNLSRRRKSDKNQLQSFYEREKSPEALQQSYYVVQDKNGSPNAVVVRRRPVGKVAGHADRHSVFTEQPSRFPGRATSKTPDRSWLQVPGSNDGGGGGGSRISVTPDSEVADRHRRAYFKLMRSAHIDGDIGKIEVSSPYDL